MLDQRQVEHREVDRRLVADRAVIVPGVVRGQHHVARTEDDVLAVDAGEIALAGQAEADGARRVAVRRHDLVRIVQPVGRVHRGDGGALRREARIDQDQRAALRIVHGDELGGALQDRLDVVRVVPDEGHRLGGPHELLDLVVLDIRRRRPERKHVLGVEVVVERLQRDFAIAAVMGRLHVHGRSFRQNHFASDWSNHRAGACRQQLQKRKLFRARTLYARGLERRPAADHVGGLLGDHHHRGVDVAADHIGHHRGVDDAQALRSRAPSARDRPPPARPTGAHPAGAERMMHGDRGRAHVGVDLAVARLAAPGTISAATKRCIEGCAAMSRVIRTPSRSVRRSASVGEEILHDLRMRGRIGGLQRDEAAALRVQHHDAGGEHVGEGRLERREIGPAAKRRGGEQDLQVGQRRFASATSGTRRCRPAHPRRSRCRRDRPAEWRARYGRRAWRAGTGSAPCGGRSGSRRHGPAGSCPRPAKRSFTGMEWRRSSSGSPTPESMRSCGELMTPPARMTSRSARAVDRFRALAVLDADGAAALEEDARRKRLDGDRQVVPLQGGAQIGGRGAAAAAVADRHLQAAKALLLRRRCSRRSRHGRRSVPLRHRRRAADPRSGRTAWSADRRRRDRHWRRLPSFPACGNREGPPRRTSRTARLRPSGHSRRDCRARRPWRWSTTSRRSPCRARIRPAARRRAPPAR